MEEIKDVTITLAYFYHQTELKVISNEIIPDHNTV